MIKKSLIAWQLNTEKMRWFEDVFGPAMEQLGFRTRAKELMLRAARREMTVWGWAR